MKTLETRLAVDQHAAFELDGFLVLRNKGLRRAGSARFRRALTEPRTRPPPVELGLASNQAGSILDEVATRHQMLRELKKTELAAARTGFAARRAAASERQAHRRALAKRIAKDRARRHSAEHRRGPAGAERDRRLRKLRADAGAASNWIAQKAMAIVRKERRIARLDHELEIDRFSLCFGSKTPPSQHPLLSPGITPAASIEEWRQAWQDARMGHVSLAYYGRADPSPASELRNRPLPAADLRGSEYRTHRRNGPRVSLASISMPRASRGAS